MENDHCRTTLPNGGEKKKKEKKEKKKAANWKSLGPNTIYNIRVYKNDEKTRRFDKKKLKRNVKKEYRRDSAGLSLNVCFMSFFVPSWYVRRLAGRMPASAQHLFLSCRGIFILDLFYEPSLKKTIFMSHHFGNPFDFLLLCKVRQESKEASGRKVGGRRMGMFDEGREENKEGNW